MAFKLWHVPVRLATGAYILNSGLSKRNADKETAEQLHGFATTAYPQFADTPPEQFVKMLSTGETMVGAMLLIPFVPAGIAGLALSTFSGGLLRLYWQAPGTHEEGSVKPTSEGIPLAKDSWMFGIGTALVLDAMSDKTHGNTRRSRKKRASRSNS